MTASTSIEALQAMPLFGGVRRDVLNALMAEAPIVSLQPEGFFFREQQSGRSMFVLEYGRVAVLKHWRGQDYPLRELQAGDCFGEMALVDLAPRSASVVALEEARAIEIDNGLLYGIYARDPEQFTLMQMNLARELSRRLRHADERLLEIKIASGASAGS